jgi:hypothetical protein
MLISDFILFKVIIYFENKEKYFLKLKNFINFMLEWQQIVKFWFIKMFHFTKLYSIFVKRLIILAENNIQSTIEV